MVSVFDVVAYILDKKGTVSTWKLQKLVYYCQAWSLVWDETPLFDEEIQAWINGPVCPVLYEQHKGSFFVSEISGGKPENLNHTQIETIDAVLDFYGDKPPQWLSTLTHMEDPWKKARRGLPPRERGKNVITLESMAEYYEHIAATSESSLYD
ncbi:MAG: DUF4065 domain-containing protein [Bacteroidetes bacterium]|nr:DUF4065 domain-containing protein [Bacteroidota bacterium]